MSRSAERLRAGDDAPTATTGTDGAREVELAVSGMTCGSCAARVQRTLGRQTGVERASRLVLRNHLETCVAAAMQAGRIEEIVDELMEALRYDRIATGPGGAELAPLGEGTSS